MPPYSDEMGGFVCNVAISRYATVSRSARGERRATRAIGFAGDRSIAEARGERFRHAATHGVTVASDFPVGAGLGGSSAVGVATVAALAAARGETMTPTAIAELSREIEISDLGIPGGRQDHYAAAYGGALGLRFSARARRRATDSARRARRARRSSGAASSSTPGRVASPAKRSPRCLDAYRERDPRVLNALQRHARELRRADGRRARRPATSIGSRRSSASSGRISDRCIRRFRRRRSTRSSHARTRRRRRRRQGARRVGRRLRAR